VLWKADERETDDEIGARGTRFVEALMQASLGALALTDPAGPQTHIH